MDIIPKNRVRPSATSRPVIATSMPAVADNTMTTPSGAPTLQIAKRRQITISPPADSELNKEDVMPNVAAGSVAQEQAPAAQGVSVSELLAKRQEKTLATPVEEPVLAPAPELEVAAAEPAVAPGTTPELPDTEVSSVPDEDPAAAEAARLLSDTPEAEKPPAAEAVEEPALGLQPAEEAKVETEIRQELDADEPVVDEPAVAEPAPASPEEQEVAVAEKSESPEAEEAKAPEPAANDSVADILKEEESEPQEHSQALKDEIKGMGDSKAEGHHEQYDGKPVIVIHKEHGPMSAVAWVLWFFLCVGLALLVVNFLLDADFITTNYNIPHTNIL